MIKKVYKKINLAAEQKFPAVYSRLYKNKLLIKYIISGCFTAFVDLTLLYLLTEYVFSEDHYLLAAMLAFIAAFIASFTLQKFWTFGDKNMEKVAGQLVVYLLVAFVNLGLNLLFILALVEIFDLWYFAAQIVSAALLASVSFILYNRFVFKSSVTPGSVLLAAGIFPPDVGGPATHTLNFLQEFNDKKIKTGVVTYSDVKSAPEIDKKYDIERVSRSVPYGIRHLQYFFRLLTSSLKYENIYAQDISAAGLPAMVVCRLINRRLFLRIGGDLLWERLAERGKTNLSVVNFYKGEKYMKYFLYHVGQSVLMRAEKIIVPTDLLANIYTEHYGIAKEKIIVMPNPLPINMSEFKGTPAKDKKIIFAGRLVKYKNLEKLIIAFANIYSEIGPAKLVIYGDGPEKRTLVRLAKKLNLRNQIIFEEKIAHDELMSEINDASMCVGPALTEFNPNFILECLSLKKPVLLTKENGLSVKLPERFLVDAGDIREMEEKIKTILSLGGVAPDDLVETIKSSKAESWDDIIKKHLQIFRDR